jgi:predicted DNA-binding transcriptional regulator YafY
VNPDTRDKLTFRRRLALLALLHRSPQPYHKIVAALDQQKLFYYDSHADKATVARLQKYQFRYDLRTLKQTGCLIEFDRTSKCYCWRNSPFGLSFNPTQLNALALLCDTFATATMPHADDVRELLAFLAERLSPQQKKAMNDQCRVFSIDLRETTDYRNVDPKTLQEIKRAIQRTQQLEFVYRSSYKGQERRHVIEPKPLVFKEGHVYLYGRAVEGNKELHFRLDHIVPGTAHMLSTSFTHARPHSRSYTLRYWLSPALARNGVSNHFPSERQVEMHADGSATVTARIDNLFEARRKLFSYGINCVVLEPPELLADMRLFRDHLIKTYGTPSE